eukprot:356602-Chlamydomonas_euryale.AAC.3
MLEPAASRHSAPATSHANIARQAQNTACGSISRAGLHASDRRMPGTTPAPRATSSTSPPRTRSTASHSATEPGTAPQIFAAAASARSRSELSCRPLACSSHHAAIAPYCSHAVHTSACHGRDAGLA